METEIKDDSEESRRTYWPHFIVTVILIHIFYFIPEGRDKMAMQKAAEKVQESSTTETGGGPKNTSH